MAKASDIYERQAALPTDYAWDARGRSLAKAVRAGQVAFRVAAIALIVAVTAWYAGETTAFAGIFTFLALLLSVLVLCFGLSASLVLAVRRSLWKAGPRTRHDYSLWLYRHGPGRLPKQAATLLLGMARANMEEGRFAESRLALQHIDEGQLGQDELKLFHLLWLVSALESADGRTSEVEERLVRYEAVPSKTWGGFPSSDGARSWLGSEDRNAKALAALKRVRAPRGIHPVCALLLTLMVFHCLAFGALLAGINTEGGWRLRCDYANAGSLPAVVFMLVLGVVAAVLAWKRGPRRTRPGAAGTVLSGLLSAVAVVLALCLAFVTFVDGCLSYDGDERVLASGVEDTYSGRRYDYLAVDWRGYDPSDVTTDWWRTDNPLLMEKWSDARAYDKKATKSVASTGASSDTSDSGTAASSGDGTTSGQDSGTSDGSASTTASEGRMRTLATYLVDQGVMPKTGTFQVAADAKGNAYASLGTGTDNEDSKAVVVEYRILSNGEKSDAQGQASEEFVLEKWYPEDEGRDQQILGFYLVNESTSAVTDEERTSW